jgi:hypothetical protein
MALILVFGTINLFNRIYTKYSEFFAIIKVLKGSESRLTIGIRDEKIMTDFVKKIKIVKRIVDLAVAINNFALTLLALNSVFVYYYPNHILEAIFSSGLFLSWGYVVDLISFNGFFYFFIVCFHCKCSFSSFNALLKSFENKPFKSFKTFNKLLKDLDMNCRNVFIHNKFWMTYYLLLFVTLIPLCLAGIQQIVYNEMIPLA